jgi:glycosyltransferase involved in cell wall biosynthesis
MMQVHALIPAFNEAGTIAEVVRGISPLVGGVTVVDDGSTDGTSNIARAAGARVITKPSNEGKGMAIRDGLEVVLAGPWTHVLLMDGDLQHLPEEATSLIDVAERSGADLVLGERQFDRRAMPASRYYANLVGSAILSSFVGTTVRDTQCGFRVFTTGALRRLTLVGCGYEIETEMLVKLRRLGGRIATAPVTAVYDRGKSKLRPVRDTTRTCFLAVYYRFLESR